MRVIDEKGGKAFALDAEEISEGALSALSASTAISIVRLLSKETSFPKDIAKKLKVHEQNIYYYIRKLENAGIIRVARQEKVNGTLANYYELTSGAYFLKAREFKETSQIGEKKSGWLEPFIDRGVLKALVVVGSPDPHGPQKARSRDGYFGMDLALFLGSFLNYVPNSHVRLDTEITTEEMKGSNLIILGGPIVNKVTGLINEKLPVRYDLEKKALYSSITRKHYHSEETGIIVKAKSPFNKERGILLVAGLRNSGTKAAITAFLKRFGELQKGNAFNEKIQARVVEGIDYDSDGQVDDVEFLE